MRSASPRPLPYPPRNCSELSCAPDAGISSPQWNLSVRSGGNKVSTLLNLGLVGEAVKDWRRIVFDYVTG